MATKGPWSSAGKQILSGAVLVATVENEDDAPAVAAVPDMLQALVLAEQVLDTYHAQQAGGPAGRIYYVLQAVRDAITAAGAA